jgi:hypothetical protein
MIYGHLDISELLSIGEIKEDLEKATNKALKDLAVATHAHIVEQVQSKLRSTREKYLNALSFTQVQDDVWVINLDAKAMWIEEGIEPNTEMIDALLNGSGGKGTKTAKDGSRYRVIPFQHNTKPTSSTTAQNSLIDTIKSTFKNQNIPYGKIEKDAAGKPKTGLLHSVDIENKPIKTANVPGQGKGGIGSVMQGATGVPILKGIKVYQKEVQDKATGKSKVVKSIMTFRVVSSKHKGTGRWMHPGLLPKHFFEEAADWAMKLWTETMEQKILIDVTKGG